jgi:molecular chaperone DnaK (HSP70)
MSETPAIGIDLGMTNSAVAIAEAGDSEISSNAGGIRMTPSVVAYDGTATTVGRKAANQFQLQRCFSRTPVRSHEKSQGPDLNRRIAALQAAA